MERLTDDLVKAIEKESPFIIRAKDKNIEFVKPKNGNYFSYEELQELVEGNFEKICLQYPECHSMYINRDGKFKGLEQNVYATYLFIRSYSEIEIIFGDVMVCSSKFIK